MAEKTDHEKDCCKGGTSHKRCEPEHCLSCFTCLRRYLYGSTQREGFAELWPVWVKRWGKLQAADAVIVAMGDYEARYQDLKEMVLRLRKEKKDAIRNIPKKVSGR